LADAGLLACPARILDAGAGDAWFATQLLQAMPVGTEMTCWDAGYSPTEIAERTARSGDALRFSTRRPDARFDLLLLLDVLEHVDDDRAFLTTLVRDNLAGGGSVVVTVPAWPWLYGAHDAALNHRRRYGQAEARRLLADAGLAIVRRGGLFHALLIARG